MEIRHHLEFYFRQINRFLMPVVFWLVLSALFRLRPADWMGAPRSIRREAWRLVGLVILVPRLMRS